MFGHGFTGVCGTWTRCEESLEDYVIFKLDVEGAEYEILEKMIKEGTFKWIDKFYGEFHGWTPVPGWSAQRKEGLRNTMRSHGINMLDWAGEYKRYQDIESIHRLRSQRTPPELQEWSTPPVPRLQTAQPGWP
ncbi:hypothetical protein Bbelb_037270 [Branchiostoma belcheri]|nr:hypothetical protein Bbelb_037270 [Branchiostoma belcheri]